eukprot:607282-Pyramimonas_sp.AAC.1
MLGQEKGAPIGAIGGPRAAPLQLEGRPAGAAGGGEPAETGVGDQFDGVDLEELVMGDDPRM